VLVHALLALLVLRRNVVHAVLGLVTPPVGSPGEPSVALALPPDPSCTLVPPRGSGLALLVLLGLALLVLLRLALLVLLGLALLVLFRLALLVLLLFTLQRLPKGLGHHNAV